MCDSVNGFMELYLTGSKLKEDIIFSIISYGGDAKALAYEVIEASDEGDFEKAQSLLEEADASLKVAHNTQTQLVTANVNGDN